MPRTVRFRSRIGIELRLVVLALALLLTPVFTVVIGAAAVPLDEVVGVLVSHIPGIDVQITWDRSTDAIVWDTRLPRIIAGVAVAAILGVAGVVLQAVSVTPWPSPTCWGSVRVHPPVPLSPSSSSALLVPWPLG